MAVYDGFFDATLNEETGEYDRAYGSSDFTNYFAQIIGSGVCVHDNPDSFKVRLEGGKAVVSPGYLFIQGYWCKNDADYTIDLPGTGNYAIVAHLNLGKRMIELEARSVAQAYPDSLVLAIVSPTSAEDTRYNTDICGVIDTAGELSSKVEWALNYIDSEIESKLAAVEQDIAAQERKLDAKIAEVQAVADSIVPPPVGTIKFSVSQDVGEEWLQCDGSFVSESQYPELVAALGKLTPSGDKFQLISDGEIGPQISNGVVYGGRMWVYSYSTQKLYGVDLEGSKAVKEISITSEDTDFSMGNPPSTAQPIALSIVKPESGGNVKLFLAQIIQSGSINFYTENGELFKKYLWLYSADFDPSADFIPVSRPFSSAKTNQNNAFKFYANGCVPYVASRSAGGGEIFFVVAGLQDVAQYILEWNDGEETAAPIYLNDYTNNTSFDIYYSKGQRTAFSQKNKGESVTVVSTKQSMGSPIYRFKTFVSSERKGIFERGETDGTNHVNEVLTTPTPLNIVGEDKMLFEASRSEALVISLKDADLPQKVNIGLPLPSAARIFVDGGAYLWGKDIYMVFVGTGIIFSRTLEEGSFGYLDTTSVLGTITQFGYLDYSQDEGTLYLLGQDTSNQVKAAKIVLNTLYDYANDGAWLPMIASDGVPAYIKAKEAE